MPKLAKITQLPHISDLKIAERGIYVASYRARLVALAFAAQTAPAHHCQCCFESRASSARRMCCADVCALQESQEMSVRSAPRWRTPQRRERQESLEESTQRPVVVEQASSFLSAPGVDVLRSMACQRGILVYILYFLFAKNNRKERTGASALQRVDTEAIHHHLTSASPMPAPKCGDNGARHGIPLLLESDQLSRSLCTGI